MDAKFLLLTLSAATLLLAACKKEKLTSLDVPKEDIYIDYQLTYSNDNQSTFFMATFLDSRRASSGIVLGSNSRLFANNLTVGLDQQNQLDYRRYFGGHQDSLTVRWEYEEGTDLFTYNNQLKIPAAISGNTCIINAWHATAWGYDLIFEGDSIGHDEQVFLTLRVSNPDTTFSIQHSSSTEGRNFVHIPATTVQVLYEYGLSCSYFLSRTRKKSLAESTTAGGTIEESYISDVESIYFQ